jgi:hypothetical protein
MDAITMLRDDHRSVEKLFRRFEDAGARAFAEKRVIGAVLEAKASSEQVAKDVRSGAARTAKAGKASAKA